VERKNDREEGVGGGGANQKAPTLTRSMGAIP